MHLPRFDYHEPATVAEACQMLAEFGDTAKIIAGGTDLLVNMKKEVLAPAHLVSLGRLDELTPVEFENGRVKIGACFTIAELAASAQLGRVLGALCQGARSLGSPLIRNLATVGGNIGSARPAADLPAPLMAYGCQVVLKSAAGERSLSLDDIFVGPGLTRIEPREILTEIHVDLPQAQAGAGYINLGVRKAQDCNIVNVASFLQLDDDQTISNARVVLGSVGPTHLRAPSAEGVLKGEKPSPKLLAEAGRAAQNDCTPILDFRGSAEYRRAMVGVLTERTLKIALGEARHRR